MFKLDLSVLRDKGFMINQLRLIHSKRFRNVNVMKNKQVFVDNEDLTGERNFLTEYIIEGCEISYTWYLILSGLTFVTILIMLIFLFLYSFVFGMIFLFISFICHFLSDKSYTNFVMGNMGIEMSESFYNFKIRSKYNIK